MRKCFLIRFGNVLPKSQVFVGKEVAGFGLLFDLFKIKLIQFCPADPSVFSDKFRNARSPTLAREAADVGSNHQFSANLLFISKDGVRDADKLEQIEKKRRDSSVVKIIGNINAVRPKKIMRKIFMVSVSDNETRELKRFGRQVFLCVVGGPCPKVRGVRAKGHHQRQLRPTRDPRACRYL